MEEQNKKDETLSSRLKEVYVTSHDVVPGIPIGKEKPLPSERKNVLQPEFGYEEPARITKGKLSIRQALILIGRHQQDSIKYNALTLANEYTIHPRLAGTESNELIENN
jgi:NADH dehydrogenase [ubiquinone] 1 alpha subcomplex assembly factor 4